MPEELDWFWPEFPPGITDPGEAAGIAETGGRHTIETFTKPEYFEVGPGEWDVGGDGGGEQGGAEAAEQKANGELPTGVLVGGLIAAGVFALLLWR